MAWVCLLTTGGTIASQRVEAQDHVVANVTGDELLEITHDIPSGDVCHNMILCFDTLRCDRSAGGKQADPRHSLSPEVFHY